MNRTYNFSKVLSGVLLLALFALSGCASKLMQSADPVQAVMPPSPEQAKIVFFRPSILGYAIQAYICEVKNEQLEYVGIASAKTKFSLTTAPGKHIFMAGGEYAELLEADLAPGQTYYTYISPRPGLWKAAFVFSPVSREMLTEDLKDIQDDLNGCDWVQPLGSAGQAWFRDNYADLYAEYKKALQEFKNPTIEERKILKAEDGLSQPLP